MDQDGGVKVNVSKESGTLFSTHDRNKHYRFDVISLCEILFADDAELVASSIESLQFMVSIFAGVAKAYGQQVSVSKTKVMVVYCKEYLESLDDRIGLHNGAFLYPNVYIDGHSLEVVQNFKYVGSTESDTANMDIEISIRKQRMSMAFSSLAGRVFENRSLALRTKLLLFNSIVVENGVYGCGAWNTTVSHIHELEMTQFRLLRRILGVRKRDFTSNEMIISKASSCGVTIVPLEVVIRKRRLMYLGHILRQDTTSLLYQMFHSEIQDGKRRRGGQEQSFRRSIISDLDFFNIGYSTVAEYASLKDNCKDIAVWRKCVQSGSVSGLAKWLSERAIVKAKRDADNDLKEAPCEAAIASGHIVVSRGSIIGDAALVLTMTFSLLLILLFSSSVRL